MESQARAQGVQADEAAPEAQAQEEAHTRSGEGTIASASSDEPHLVDGFHE